MIPALAAAGLSSGALAGVEYSVIPLMVSLATRIGVITPPPSMSWIGSPEAIAAAIVVYALGAIVDNMQRPNQAKRFKRIIGGSFAAAGLAAVGMASASRAGIEGHLFAANGTALNALNTHAYTGADVAVLASIAAVSVPMAGFGKGLRQITGKLPFIRSVHVMMASFGIISGALLSRMPGEVQVTLAVAAVIAIVVLGVNIVLNTRRLAHWFSSEEAPSGQRLAVLAEVPFPGLGAALMGHFWEGLPRMAFSLLLILGFLVFGLVIIPIYIRTGLAGALSVSRMASQEAEVLPFDDGPDEDMDRYWRRQRRAVPLRLGAGRLEEDW